MVDSTGSTSGHDNTCMSIDTLTPNDITPDSYYTIIAYSNALDED